MTFDASSSASVSAPHPSTWPKSSTDSSMVNSLGTTVRSRSTTAARSSTSRRSALASSTGLTSLRPTLAKALFTTRSTPFSKRSRTPMPPPPSCSLVPRLAPRGSRLLPRWPPAHPRPGRLPRSYRSRRTSRPVSSDDYRTDVALSWRSV
ncbi:Uncharacterised protein [Mycobacteroides abscessus]|nr:Uncharacterised protein [Mycobacteroides abscessus]